MAATWQGSGHKDKANRRLSTSVDYFFGLACERAEPATLRSCAVARGSLRTRAASDATRGDVCFVLVLLMVIMSFRHVELRRKGTPVADDPLDNFGIET